jgi:hypothetical protein
MVEPLTTEELGIVEETVLSLLRKGKVEAKPSRQIIAELQSLGIDLGGDPTRELRDIMHKLRLKGYPICASNDTLAGYFLAETPDELWDYIQRELDRLRQQAKPIAALRKVYRRWVDELEGQRKLSVISEEGQTFLRSLLHDSEIELLRQQPDLLSRLATRLYDRAYLAKMTELQDFTGHRVRAFLNQHNITEDSIREFLKDCLLKGGESGNGKRQLGA